MNSSFFPFDKCCAVVVLAAVVCGAAASTSSEHWEPTEENKKKILSELDDFLCDKTQLGQLYKKTQMESVLGESWLKDDGKSSFIDSWKGYFVSVASFSKKEVDPIYHGCCSSQPISIAPDSAEDEAGNKVKLVQGKNKKQCFWSDTCVLVQPCDSNCGCRQGMIRHRAAIYNPKDGKTWKWSYVKIPGCCKCLQNAPQVPLPQQERHPLCM